NEASAIGVLQPGVGASSRMNGTPVQGATVPAGAVNGAALVTGQWNGQALVARAVAADPTLRFADRAQKVVIETLASGSLGAG
ncbi:hypothetical protein OFB83_33200, partial [Escherichia coli]|nr:hypothetical protein [Escherichia coli]